jgi:hypothetical protein
VNSFRSFGLTYFVFCLGGATQAQSVKEIGVMAREFISSKTGAPAASFDCEVFVQGT